MVVFDTDENVQDLCISFTENTTIPVSRLQQPKGIAIVF